jgi:hypothetical protein
VTPRLLCKLNRSNPYRRFADIPNRPPAINPYRRHRFPAEIISHCVWLYFRFCLSCRDIQELMAARGVIRPYEAVRYCCVKCGQPYANQLRQRWPSRTAAPRGPSIRPWVSWSTRRICGPTPSSMVSAVVAPPAARAGAEKASSSVRVASRARITARAARFRRCTRRLGGV